MVVTEGAAGQLERLSQQRFRLGVSALRRQVGGEVVETQRDPRMIGADRRPHDGQRFPEKLLRLGSPSA